MAVAITSPQSAVIARGKFTLAWTHTYPQAAYEVMYRKKGETAWSTFGRITGTATSITVDCSRFDDFVEYQYRVIVYSEYANTTETTYSGSDASAGYAFILVPDSMVGTMKVKYGDGMIEVPLYSTPQSGKQTISIGENKKTQLLNNDDSLSGSRSKVKVRTNNETKSLPRSDKYLSDPGVNSYKSMLARSTYYTTYTIPAYYKYVPAYYKYTASPVDVKYSYTYDTTYNYKGNYRYDNTYTYRYKYSYRYLSLVYSVGAYTEVNDPVFGSYNAPAWYYQYFTNKTGYDYDYQTGGSSGTRYYYAYAGSSGTTYSYYTYYTKYYQYTAPIYAYTPPKYYQPIHYQYQTI